jgi:molybdopterin/thiamine biosynthesis adenylyltransferase
VPRSLAPQDLDALLDSLAVQAARPDGSPYRSLPEAAAARLAEAAGLSRREAELAALDRDIVPERYARNLSCLSAADQRTLLASRVVLVGLGGLGGHVLEILARTGVGRIAAADGDTFVESNLNRQLLATDLTLGRSKAGAALDRAARINPAVELDALDEYLSGDRLDSVLRGADLAVDCLGGLADRLMLQRAAAEASIPLVTAAVAGLTGLVATVWPGETGPADLFCPPEPQADAAPCGAEDALGCLAPAVALAAALQAAEAVKVLTGRASLRGRMLLFDLDGPAGPGFDTLELAPGTGP